MRALCLREAPDAGKSDAGRVTGTSVLACDSLSTRLGSPRTRAAWVPSFYPRMVLLTFPEGQGREPGLTGPTVQAPHVEPGAAAMGQTQSMSTHFLAVYLLRQPGVLVPSGGLSEQPKEWRLQRGILMSSPDHVLEPVRRFSGCTGSVTANVPAGKSSGKTGHPTAGVGHGTFCSAPGQAPCPSASRPHCRECRASALSLNDVVLPIWVNYCSPGLTFMADHRGSIA